MRFALPRRFLWVCLILLTGTGLGNLASRSACAKDVVFVGYNVENYSPIRLPSPAGATRIPFKSESSAAAVVRIIKELDPDILGVCEMGAPVQFEEFRARLAAAGLGYIDAEWVDGPDIDRHLALLSRFPIIARQSQVGCAYEADGVRQKVRRGFLDVTVQVAPNFRLRIVGAHLKSKLPSSLGPSELMRRQEGHLLRRRIDQILKENPDQPLLVFGDLNDTKAQPVVQEISGPRGSPLALRPLPLVDSVGDRWTHYWKQEDLYSRIDYIFVNRALAPRVIAKACGIYRAEGWFEASDHRPVYATFTPIPAPRAAEEFHFPRDEPEEATKSDTP